METLNCMKCKYRHEDNGNCTAVGGFCTAVQAAHCPLLRKYLDTGLTPERCAEFARADAEGRYIVMRDAEQEGVARLRELAEADKDGRCVVLPCKVGDTVWRIKRTFETYPDKSEPYIEPDAFLLQDVFNIGKTVFLTREEADHELKREKGW